MIIATILKKYDRNKYRKWTENLHENEEFSMWDVKKKKKKLRKISSNLSADSKLVASSLKIIYKIPVTISRKVTKACNLFPERKIDKEIIKSILKIVVEDSHKNVTNYRRLNV